LMLPGDNMPGDEGCEVLHLSTRGCGLKLVMSVESQ